MGGGTSLLAEASLKLAPAPRPPATTWLPLIGPALPTPHIGELMFSLSYLPTAERLTLVVVKARNLKGANSSSGDTFVKVYENETQSFCLPKEIIISTVHSRYTYFNKEKNFTRKELP